MWKIDAERSMARNDESDEENSRLRWWWWEPPRDRRGEETRKPVGKRIKRSYENKAKPEGGVQYAHATIDTQDRHSNFRSCHSDASWCAPPRPLHAFTHTLAKEVWRLLPHASSTHTHTHILIYTPPHRWTFMHVYIRSFVAQHPHTDANYVKNECLPDYYARIDDTTTSVRLRNNPANQRISFHMFIQTLAQHFYSLAPDYLCTQLSCILYFVYCFVYLYCNVFCIFL